MIFLIFSDSLDDSLIKFNYWKNKILYNKNNSFIFFISNHDLPNNKQEIIINMWNKFKKKSNENSNSKIIFIQELNEKGDFKNIEEFLNKLEIKEKNYKNIQPRNKLKEININYFDKILNCEEFKQLNTIYFVSNTKKIKKNKQIKISNKIESNPSQEVKNSISSYKSQIPQIKEHLNYF